MDFELKPIRLLATIAYVLHIFSLVVIVALTVFQVPIKRLLFWTIDPVFISPSPVLIVTSVVIFVIHSILAVNFRKALTHDSVDLRRLNTVSILSIIFMTVVMPAIGFISQFAERYYMFFMGMHGHDHFAEAIATMQLLSYGRFFQNHILLVLLVAASMSIYYCRNKKAELLRDGIINNRVAGLSAPEEEQPVRAESGF